jgi:hypothetical protein
MKRHSGHPVAGNAETQAGRVVCFHAREPRGTLRHPESSPVRVRKRAILDSPRNARERQGRETVSQADAADGIMEGMCRRGITTSNERRYLSWPERTS